MTQVRELRTDVLIVGGGLGGVAGALAAVRRGARVIVTEESAWLGGQLTTQAAPPDEHPWIEHTGATATYRELRQAIRDIFRRTYRLTPAAGRDAALNPGAGWVSPLCVEPRLAQAAIEGLLARSIAEGRLIVLRHVRASAADVHGDRVRSVTLRDRSGSQVTVEAPFVLDATEEGDLLPLTGVEHVTGSESGTETGEPSAPSVAAPNNMQAITHAFAIDHLPDQDRRIPRPLGYERWRDARPPGWPGPLLGWNFPNPRTGMPVRLPFTPNAAGPPLARAHFGDDPADRDLWRYRRVLARHQVEDAIGSDVTIVNWPMNDYFEGVVTGAADDVRRRSLMEAKDLSLSLLHWLQTEAPRSDGGVGWPGLGLRGDVLGTEDGLAMRPYIRESRRIRARTMVREQDISRRVRGERGAVRYADSVGVGSYRIDLHPSTGGDLYVDVESCPFEIPLGAIVPQRVSNLYAAAKNIGTTHITSGCYRVHPVEWTVGEAAGALATFCLANRTGAEAVCEDPAMTGQFQDELIAGGTDLRWPAGIN